MNYKFYWPVLWQYRNLLIEGFWITMVLFVTGAVLAITLGLIVGTVGASRSRALRILGEAYVEFNRNTPMVVKLFFLYFAFGFEAYEAAIIGLALHQSAYMAEVFRSGINSVSTGQMEAGISSGLTRSQVLRKIILPQALVIVIPPITTQVLETLKNTSIAMTIAIPELTFQTQQIESFTFRGFEAATAATLLYLAVGFVISGFAVGLEIWIARSRVRVRPLQLGTV